MSQALYAQWSAESRRTWGWASIGVVLLTYVLSAIPSAVLAAALIVMETLGGAEPQAAQRALQANTLGYLLPAILSQFFIWAVLIWLWARLFERRSGPTLGLRLNGLTGLRYVFGLVLGIGLLIAIGSVALLLGDGTSASDMNGLGQTKRLFEPFTLAVLAFVIVVFLVQGGAEEIIFRGWLMSTLSARWNAKAAVIVSSLCFMVLHAHVFISGLVFGIVALAGLGLMGLVFALLCLVTRSVVEAAAAHGAFNAAAITVPSAMMLVENPHMSLSEILRSVFTVSTGTMGPGAISIGPEMLAQGLTAGVISAVLAVLLVRRRAFERWRPRQEA